MAVSERVNLFTTTMRDEFLTQYYEYVAKPSPLDNIMQVIPSTGRFEHYPWLSPVPGLERYKGHRRFGKIGTITYKVENLEYDSAFEVLLRDIEDDQVGGYQSKPQELAVFAKLLPQQLTLQHLANGKTALCFDDTAFFANNHTIGTGDNLLAGTAAASDGVTHKMVVCVHNEQRKPIIYQNRKEPKFDTDANSTQSGMAKMVRYWIDMEGACGYGNWWNAILVEYANTPTITEIQTDLGLVEAAFAGFKLHENIAGAQPQYIHAMLDHSTENTTIVASPKLKHLLRQALNSDVIVNGSTGISNIYKGFAGLVLNPYFS